MRFPARFEFGWRHALVALLLAACPALSNAQTTSASVSGIVEDAQGGVLPGVTVTITSRTQGNTLTAVMSARVSSFLKPSPSGSVSTPKRSVD